MDVRGSRLQSLDIFVTPTRRENSENNSKCFPPSSFYFGTAKSLTLASKQGKGVRYSLSLSLAFPFLSLYLTGRLRTIKGDK